MILFVNCTYFPPHVPDSHYSYTKISVYDYCVTNFGKVFHLLEVPKYVLCLISL
jgi:hypothetical protein